jgi:hypothetical protein
VHFNVYSLHKTIFIALLVVRVPISSPPAAVDPFTGRSLPQNLGRGSARSEASLIETVIGAPTQLSYHTWPHIRCMGWQACIDDTLQQLAAAANAGAIHMLSTPAPPCTMRQAEGAAASAYSQREAGLSMR